MAKRMRNRGTGSIYRRGDGRPWMIAWFDHEGRRKEHNTLTTDRAAAERILRERLSEAALRRDGVIDPDQDRYSTEARRPLREHVDAYIEHCRRIGQNARHVDQKDAHLAKLLESSKATRLTDLTSEKLEHHMAKMRDEGLSARSSNFARQIAVAFLQWCVKTSRVPSNPLRVVHKLDERNDRRRVRRPLTDDELGRLIAVGREHGREAWYLAAALAGLRRGDLVALTWSDVSFADGTITIRGGKAKRVDVVPMHPQLTEALRGLQRASPGMPKARVFRSTVTSRTQLGDFLRAGLAREEAVTDAKGRPVMTGRGKVKRPKLRIVTTDADGRVIDLHALRTTLGTQLARAGVAPQIAQRLMRHGDYRTTLAHYTVLGLADVSKAVDALPTIRTDAREALATGTGDALPQSARTPHSTQSAEAGASGARRRDGGRTERSDAGKHKPRSDAGFSETMRGHAGKRVIGIEPTTFSLGRSQKTLFRGS
jgi:integrase